MIEVVLLRYTFFFMEACHYMWFGNRKRLIDLYDASAYNKGRFLCNHSGTYHMAVDIVWYTDTGSPEYKPVIIVSDPWNNYIFYTEIN